MEDVVQRVLADGRIRSDAERAVVAAAVADFEAEARAAHSAEEEGSSRAQAWLADRGYPDRTPSPAAERFRTTGGAA